MRSSNCNRIVRKVYSGLLGNIFPVYCVQPVRKYSWQVLNLPFISHRLSEHSLLINSVGVKRVQFNGCTRELIEEKVCVHVLQLWQ